MLIFWKHAYSALSFNLSINKWNRLFNPPIALGEKSSQLSFWIGKKISVQHWALSFVTFPEYEVGTKRNNQVANRCTRSCLAWRQTRMNYFETGEILWSCWLIWQNRSRISIHIHIHIKFKTRVKTVKVNSEKHTQVYGMYRAV